MLLGPGMRSGSGSGSDSEADLPAGFSHLLSWKRLDLGLNFSLTSLPIYGLAAAVPVRTSTVQRRVSFCRLVFSGV